jgi:hypothetical protein
LITLTYLTVVPMRFSETKANHAGVIAGVEGLTMVFWFAGFLALAVWLGNRVCFGHVCSAAKAATAFGAFAWYVKQLRDPILEFEADFCGLPGLLLPSLSLLPLCTSFVSAVA